MPFLMVNQGEGIMATLLLDQTLLLKLFKNDQTPADGHTEANYTEADFIGYDDFHLTLTDWTITPGAPTLATAAQKTFASTQDQTEQLVYGYYLVQSSDGKLICVRRFANPLPFSKNGDAIDVVAKISIKKPSEV